MPYLLGLSNLMLLLTSVMYLLFNKVQYKGGDSIWFIWKSGEKTFKVYRRKSMNVECTIMKNWWRLCYYIFPMKQCLIKTPYSSTRTSIHCQLCGWYLPVNDTPKMIMLIYPGLVMFFCKTRIHKFNVIPCYTNKRPQIWSPSGTCMVKMVPSTR